MSSDDDEFCELILSCFYNFLKNEEGSSTLETIGLIGIVALLLGCIISIGSRVNTTAQHTDETWSHVSQQVTSLLEK